MTRRRAGLLAALGAVAVLSGCKGSPGQPGGAGASGGDEASAEARQLHVRLFGAADAGDVSAFRAVLSRSSEALMQTHFEAMAQLPRPAGHPPFGWRDILRQHAALPASARTRAPYPVIQEGGEARLDLAGHADAAFFAAAAAAIGQRGAPRESEEQSP